MTRWPLILLTLALAGAAAAVVGRRAAEPDRPNLSTSNEFDEIAAERDHEVKTLRILAKQHIAHEVAAGALPLLKAAALFRALNRHPPAVVVVNQPSLDGLSDEEELCQQVIRYVDNLEHDWPEAAAAMARLQAELQEELRRHGAVQLPDLAGQPSAAELLEQTRATMTEAERRSYFSTHRGQPPGR
jgi:hypothetical protein